MYCRRSDEARARRRIAEKVYARTQAVEAPKSY